MESLPSVCFLVRPPVTGVEDDYISIMVIERRGLDHVKPEFFSSISTPV